jgi:hypothetical protein
MPATAKAEPIPQYAHCTSCKEEWVAFYQPALMEDVARFMRASTGCPACGKQGSAVMGRYGNPYRRYRDYEDWLENGEVGVSSRTILAAITGRTIRYTNHPMDPGDFRRCHLLLQAFPELRLQLHKVAEQYPVWAELVKRWNEVEAMLKSEVGDIAEWRKGSARKTYYLMQELIAKGNRRAAEL